MHKGISGIYDVAVCGGGLCGIGAAFRLADEGKSVLLIERRPQLAWETASAMSLEIGKSRTAHVKKIASRLRPSGGGLSGAASPAVAEISINRLAREEGVDVLLYSYPLRFFLEDGLISGVAVGNKSGEQLIRAKVFIDATEEAVLWEQAGAEFEKGACKSFRHSIFLNGLKERVKPGAVTGGVQGVSTIGVESCFWPEECCVSFSGGFDGSISLARSKVPDVLSLARGSVPGLEEAFVTHTGFELFPEEPERYLLSGCSVHPGAGNLFSAALWAFPDRKERILRNSISGRLETGEAAADMVSRNFKKYRRHNPVPSELPEDRHSAEINSSVVVAGGGASGAFAAIAAARNNAETAVIEAGTMLGGIPSGGGIHNYYYGVPGGIQDELDERVAEISPLFSGKFRAVGFHPEARKIVLERMCNESGVKIYYSGTSMGVLKKGRKIKALQIAFPRGKVLFGGEVFIDCTGDGDVALSAGVPSYTGRAADGIPHAYSQSGGYFDLREGAMKFLNFDAGYVDPANSEDLTRGRLLGVSHLEKDDYSDGVRLSYIAPQIGLRQSRQVKGGYTVTLEDEVSGARFDDCVGFQKSHYDNHSSRYFDIANQSDAAVLWAWMLGNWRREIGCEVPYRSLLPAGTDNLLVACRAMSIDVEAHYGFRMIRDMQRVGEAGGAAAAVSAEFGVPPRRIDVSLLQKRLRKSGALDTKMRPAPAIPDLSFNQLKKIFFSDSPYDAVWVFSHRKEHIPFLTEVLKNEDGWPRYWAAVCLAMHGRKAAVPELIKSVSERLPFVPEGYQTVPLWQSSIVLLGRVGDERAVDVIAEVLSDPDVGIDVIIASVRALGRIGSPRAAPVLKKLMKRKSPDYTRVLAPSTPVADRPVKDDSRFQVELAAAEALLKIGCPADEIIERHIRDPRAYVRSFAGKLKD